MLPSHQYTYLGWAKCHHFTDTSENGPCKCKEIRSSAKLIDIGEDCWIAVAAGVLAGSPIGNSVIVAADAVITKNVEANI
jgi:acetyltransferase-like isoleucine patch superfamily enzyme